MSVVQETIDAYSDANSRSEADRDLHFLASEWVDYSDMLEAFDKAVENGYNRFNSSLLNAIGAFEAEDLQFRPAREYSPCLYVRGDRDTLAKVVKLNLRADEVSMREASEYTDLDPETRERSQTFPELSESDVDVTILRLWWD